MFSSLDINLSARLVTWLYHLESLPSIAAFFQSPDSAASIIFLNLDNNLIDFITEASPYKIGKFTPLSRIPIKNDKAVKKIKSKFYAIIFSYLI